MVLIEVLVNQGKRLVLTLLKQRQNLSLYYNVDNSYFFFNGKEIFNFKAND